MNKTVSKSLVSDMTSSKSNNLNIIIYIILKRIYNFSLYMLVSTLTWSILEIVLNKLITYEH